VAAILGDGEQYVQDICVVGLVERRCLSDDAVAPRRSLPETKTTAPEQEHLRRNVMISYRGDGDSRWIEREDEREHMRACGCGIHYLQPGNYRSNLVTYQTSKS
jgi:hypothetical protein